jgi:hypothetical protein
VANRRVLGSEWTLVVAAVELLNEQLDRRVRKVDATLDEGRVRR